jgi:ABC-type sugar transport system ATPase subunit
METSTNKAPLPELKGITTRFPGVPALGNMSFYASLAEVAALIGGNGAGKSTLMKNVSGVCQPDEG